jgi:hypothetical protein
MDVTLPEPASDATRERPRVLIVEEDASTRTSVAAACACPGLRNVPILLLVDKAAPACFALLGTAAQDYVVKPFCPRSCGRAR